MTYFIKYVVGQTTHCGYLKFRTKEELEYYKKELANAGAKLVECRCEGPA